MNLLLKYLSSCWFLNNPSDLVPPNSFMWKNVAFYLISGMIVEGLISDPADGTLEVRSTVPLSSGLGSSASLCVALARAFSRLHGAGTDPADIQKLANAAEQAAHGRASGLDTAAIAWGRPRNCPPPGRRWSAWAGTVVMWS
jgi:mevalonate kinase